MKKYTLTQYAELYLKKLKELNGDEFFNFIKNFVPARLDYMETVDETHYIEFYKPEYEVGTYLPDIIRYLQFNNYENTKNIAMFQKETKEEDIIIHRINVFYENKNGRKYITQKITLNSL